MLNITKMNSMFFLIFVTALFSLFNPLSARSENIGPFGLDVGNDTFEELKKGLDSNDCDYNGFSAITSGTLAICSSRIFDFDGLLGDVVLVFGENNKLDAVSMTISKHKFDSILSSLSSKYKVIKKVKPYVGSAYAKLKSRNINIVLDAPHLSFEMTLLYSTDDFDKKYNEYNNKKQQERKTKQREQL